MTEVNESSSVEPEPTAKAVNRDRRAYRPARRDVAKAVAAEKAPRRPVRTTVIGLAVAAMAATVIVPTVGAMTSSAVASSSSTMSLQQAAENGSQSFVAASSVAGKSVARDSYSATTHEEIEKAKAEAARIEAAKKAAEEAAKAAASKSASVASAMSSQNFALTAPGSGEVRFPLMSYSYIGDGYGMRSGRLHAGVDMLAPAMTPIYAVHGGTVVVSSNSYYGFGTGVRIEGNVGGTLVGTNYGHMTYNTMTVGVGQTVSAGDLIGFVGNTGNSFGNHLHLEVSLNGQTVDPMAWLNANL